MAPGTQNETLGGQESIKRLASVSPDLLSRPSLKGHSHRGEPPLLFTTSVLIEPGLQQLRSTAAHMIHPEAVTVARAHCTCGHCTEPPPGLASSGPLCFLSCLQLFLPRPFSASVAVPLVGLLMKRQLCIKSPHTHTLTLSVCLPPLLSHCVQANQTCRECRGHLACPSLPGKNMSPRGRLYTQVQGYLPVSMR